MQPNFQVEEQQVIIEFVPALLRIHKDRVFMIHTNLLRKPFGFIDQLTEHGIEAFWDQNGVTIKKGDQQEAYEQRKAYRVGGLFEEYMKLIYPDVSGVY